MKTQHAVVSLCQWNFSCNIRFMVTERIAHVLQILLGVGELLLTPNNSDAAQDSAYRAYKRKDKSLYEM